MYLGFPFINAYLLLIKKKKIRPIKLFQTSINVVLMVLVYGKILVTDGLLSHAIFCMILVMGLE